MSEVRLVKITREHCHGGGDTGVEVLGGGVGNPLLTRAYRKIFAHCGGEGFWYKVVENTHSYGRLPSDPD